MEIEGKGAVVTGGASGLGLATTREIIAAGGRVAILDLPTSAGETVAKDLGASALFCPCDVTDEEQVEAAIERAAAELGSIYIDVNCAGIGWAQRTVTRAADRMIKNEPEPMGDRGVIVNTASVAAFEGQIGQVSYSASKGAVVGMTLPIARDLASLNVRCCTIAPGLFETPLLGQMSDEQRAVLAANIPHPKRLGKPEEYALLARQIIENPRLNGETIRLDGAIRMPPKG